MTKKEALEKVEQLQATMIRELQAYSARKDLSTKEKYAMQDVGDALDSLEMSLDRVYALIVGDDA